MKQYNVTGMSCAACVAHVEKAVQAVEGVTSVTVSLLTNSMTVEGTAADSDIVAAVTKAGYGAAPRGGGSASGAGSSGGMFSAEEEALVDRETPKMKRRLFWSLILLIPLMYVSMGHAMWGWPVPEILHHNPVGIGVYQLILTVAVMVINQKFFINGFTTLLHKAPNMDTLVALGSAASFGYSSYALLAMTKLQAMGDL
ncbi:MAG: cation-translocating P-type ATPase, partial [Firmicutes bacterium]|nr:cation-translocating P-type ATPase [Bacillota bacterium]